jgi:hypothetical protein
MCKRIIAVEAESAGEYKPCTADEMRSSVIVTRLESGNKIKLAV